MEFEVSASIGWIAGLLALAAVILLQVYLSRKPQKYGLILPGCFFALSLVSMIAFVVFAVAGGSLLELLLGALVTTFLPLNIPTALLLGIYAVCHKKAVKRSESERMSVQDL